MTETLDCDDEAYRLSVYMAGHAITAYLLGQQITSIIMLPRPPMMLAEKAFASHNWDSFIETLENRVLELFGGQTAEEMICGHSSCCSGDISRIDEITRILEALYGEDDYDSEEILFDLEDKTQEMFADQQVHDAILPVAEFFFEHEEAGEMEIDGKAVTRIIDQYVPAPEKKKQGILELLKLA